MSIILYIYIYIYIWPLDNINIIFVIFAAISFAAISFAAISCFHEKKKGRSGTNCFTRKFY